MGFTLRVGTILLALCSTIITMKGQRDSFTPSSKFSDSTGFTSDGGRRLKDPKSAVSSQSGELNANSGRDMGIQMHTAEAIDFKINITTVAQENKKQENTEEDKGQTISFHFNEYVVPILLVIGLFGNSMAIAVMQRKSFEKLSICFIITALAVSDNITCLVPFNKKFVIDWLGYDIRSYSAGACKVFFWFWRTSKFTSSWFVTAISIERFVAVWMPFKARDTFTKRFALALIFSNWTFWGVFDFFWGYLTDSVINGQCQPNQSLNDHVFLEKAFSVTGGSLYSIVPGLIMLVFNTLTIFKVVQQAKRRNELTDNLKYSKETSKITFMLISISVAFLLLVVPVSFAHWLAMFTGKNDLYTSTDPTVVFMKEVTQIMEQLNYSINFFLYTMCSSMFRREVVYLLMCSQQQVVKQTYIKSGKGNS